MTGSQSAFGKRPSPSTPAGKTPWTTRPGQVILVFARFDDYRRKHVLHCHKHEDDGNVRRSDPDSARTGLAETCRQQANLVPDFPHAERCVASSNSRAEHGAVYRTESGDWSDFAK